MSVIGREIGSRGVVRRHTRAREPLAAGPARVVDIINLSSSAHTLLRDRVLAMRARGVDNRILCMDGPYVARLRADGIPVHTVPLPRGYDPLGLGRSFLAIAAYLSRERIELVHTHCSVPGVVGRLAARAAGVPVVIHTVHGFHFHEGMHPLPRAVFATVERALGALTDELLTQNRGDLDAARRHGIGRRGHVGLIGNGIELGRFVPEPGRRDPDPFVLCCVARFEPVKNHGQLFAAVRHLRDAGRAIELWLIGDGAGRPDLEMQVARLGIAAQVRFLGYRDDVPQCLARADAGVLTSVKEGIPRAVLETMAAARPVVATDVPGTREAVRHGETGLLVPLGDVTALASAIGRLMDDPGLRERLGRRGRFVVEREFDEREIVRRLAMVYQRSLPEAAIGHTGRERHEVPA